MAKTKISEFNANPALNTDIDSINLAEGCAPSGINDAIRELMSQLKDWQSGTSNDPYVVGSSGSLTLNQGTANGVAYLNGSKVVTSGSALTFDGSALLTTGRFDIQNANALQRFLNGAGTRTGYVQVRSDAYEIWSDQSAVPMVFGVSNAEGMRLTSTGLGIGTSSPTTKLDVLGSGDGEVRIRATSDAALIFSETTANKNWKLKPSSGDFYWQYSSTAYNSGYSSLMILNSSGNLGLGVTPSAWDADFKAVQIQRAAVSSYNNVIAIFSQNNYADKYIASSLAASKYQQNAGAHSWFTAASGTAGNAITFTQAMTLDASAQLQIGTTTASGKLTIDNTGASTPLIYAKSADQTGARIALSNTGTGGQTWQIVAGDVGVSNSGLSFYDGTATRARIDSSGNLLVGKTSTGSAAGLTLYGQSTISGYGRIDFNKTVTGTVTGSEYSYNGTPVGTITYSNTATAYNTSSDYRLKNVIGAVTGAGERIDALEPIEYEWKSDGSRTRGFLAHKFQEVYAGSVTGTKDAVDEQGNPVYQAMQAGSSEVIADLVAEIKSLRKRLANAGL